MARARPTSGTPKTPLAFLHAKLRYAGIVTCLEGLMRGPLLFRRVLLLGAVTTAAYGASQTPDIPRHHPHGPIREMLGGVAQVASVRERPNSTGATSFAGLRGFLDTYLGSRLLIGRP